uniref:Uncharacterized protein n=1 Tax=Aegilops tauschii subsp. strangulata TaxID=200361 RepID=A0A453N4G0_AEGTS
MEGAGERDEIGHEPHHGGAVQSGGKHKDSTTGDEKDGEFQVQPRWRKFLAHVGSGALVAIGFLDPSNLETDMQAGADFKYELLWVVLVGMIFVLFIQTLSANLGVKTGTFRSTICHGFCISNLHLSLNPVQGGILLNSAGKSIPPSSIFAYGSLQSLQ